MKIALITITRNNADGLRRTIRSVGSQSVSPAEYIIVDGNSTDHTASVLDACAGHAEVIKRQPRGVYDAINAGIERSTAPLVGLLHSGDEFSSADVLERVGAIFDSDPELDFIFGDVHFGRPGGVTTRYYSGSRGSLKSIINGFAPPHPSLYMRRSVFEKKGLYKADYKVSADFEMFARLFADSSLKWCYVPLDMVCMEPGGLSSRIRSRLWDHNIERLRALRQNGLKASVFNISKHYIHVLKSYLRLKA